MEAEARVIGEESWWDHKTQSFRKKRLNLSKVPLKFRCPNCGKIVVKTRDREPMRIIDEEDRRRKRKQIDECLEREKPLKEEWDDFVERHNDLFIPVVHLVERGEPIDLSWWGGVCKDCCLDGFGRSGGWGNFMKSQMMKDEEKRTKNSDKVPLWINGKLRLATKIIEIKTLLETTENRKNLSITTILLRKDKCEKPVQNVD